MSLSKSIFVADTPLWSGFEQIKMNTIKRQTVTITLRDQGANPTRVWKLTDVWPVTVVVNELESDGNVVAVESLEFAHSGMTIANGS